MESLENFRKRSYTVEPVYNSPALSGHPLLSGQVSKSRIFAHANAGIVIRSKRPPLLRGFGHPYVEHKNYEMTK